MNENILDHNSEDKPHYAAIWWKVGLVVGVVSQAIIIAVKWIYEVQYSTFPAWIWLVIGLLGLGVVALWVALREKPTVHYLKTLGAAWVYFFTNHSLGLLYLYITSLDKTLDYTLDSITRHTIAGFIWTWLISSLIWLTLHQWKKNHNALRSNQKL